MVASGLWLREAHPYFDQREGRIPGKASAESLRELAGGWEAAFPSLGLSSLTFRTGNGLPSLAGGSEEAALWAPKPPPGGGCHLHFRNALRGPMCRI